MRSRVAPRIKAYGCERVSLSPSVASPLIDKDPVMSRARALLSLTVLAAPLLVPVVARAATPPLIHAVVVVETTVDPSGRASDVKLVRPLSSLREVIQRDMAVTDAPELFCFGLLEQFDMLFEYEAR